MGQVCTIKIVESTPHFLHLGTQVPWSPGSQVGYLSFEWSKWAWEKNLRKNLVFWPTFVFWSILSDTLTLVPWLPWSPGTQAGYLSFQWSKWPGGKNLRKNLVFWPTFVFWSILSDTLVPWSPGHQAHRWAVSLKIPKKVTHKWKQPEKLQKV